MNTQKNSIHFEDVWKTYRVGSEDVHALAGVSISFPQGSFWAVMGPSGSGKSTLLNLLGCLDRPTRGACYIQDQPTTGIDDDALSELRLRNLGFIFQSFNLIPQLSVRENIELPLFYLGWDAARTARRVPKNWQPLSAWKSGWSHRPTELIRRAEAARGHCPRAGQRSADHCWPTNRPATWTRRPAHRSWRCFEDLNEARQDGDHGHPRARNRRHARTIACT
jgi:predicted ABC-type transport system involved in lysophospholipase L1 biosynthesis ATPase subunit